LQPNKESVWTEREAMNITLTIKMPDNFDAEDSLWNDLQDEGMLNDLIAVPVQRSLWEYMHTNYRGRLDIEVEGRLEV